MFEKKIKTYFLSFGVLVVSVIFTIILCIQTNAEGIIGKKIIQEVFPPEKLEYTYTEKPDVMQLESIFPDQIKAMDDAEKEIWIPVEWKSQLDLKTTEEKEYLFEATLDLKTYHLEESVKLPSIKVIINREAKPQFFSADFPYVLLEKSNKYYNGKLKVGYFIVQTEQGRVNAMCAQHQLAAAQVNDVFREAAVFTKATDATSERSRLLRKVMYYGWGGPGDIGPWPDTSGMQGPDSGYANDGSHYRRTSLGISVANNNSDSYYGYGKRFIDHLERNYPDAPEGFEVHLLNAPRQDNQNLVFFRYRPKGQLKIRKVSSHPEFSNENACYSLEGAEFGIYENYDGYSGTVSGEIGRLKTDYEGNSNSLDVKEGTYYIKELKAPKGFVLDPAVRTVDVKGNRMTEIKIADPPIYAPISILLTKVDAETGNENPQGEGTFEGAEFEVLFYPEIIQKIEEIEQQGKKPARRWLFQTDQKGMVRYEEGYRIQGDALYKDLKNNPAFPLGTVVIRETKAPEGYKINEETFLVPILSDTAEKEKVLYQTPVIPENILKLEVEKVLVHTRIPIPGVKFEHTNPQGEKAYYTTNKDGKFCMKGLHVGEHHIREVEAVEGVLINQNEIVFCVNEKHEIVFDSQQNSSDGTIKFEITKTGEGKLIVEDPLVPFVLKIQKENEKKQRLSNAEFTLFQDAECKKILKKAVTDQEGILRMEQLEIGKTYYLMETKAPKGYSLPKNKDGKPVVYEISAKSNPIENQFIFYVNGKEYDHTSKGMFTVEGTKKEYSGVITIKNRALKKLPATGSNVMIPILCLASACMMVSKRGDKIC